MSGLSKPGSSRVAHMHHFVRNRALHARPVRIRRLIVVGTHVHPIGTFREQFTVILGYSIPPITTYAMHTVNLGPQTTFVLDALTHTVVFYRRRSRAEVISCGGHQRRAILVARTSPRCRKTLWVDPVCWIVPDVQILTLRIHILDGILY